MKQIRTICIPKEIEAEVSYVVVKRFAGYDGQGGYSPPGKWVLVAECGDDKELAERKKTEVVDPWFEVEIKTLTSEEIEDLKEDNK